jgi:hypothetical protein
MKHLLFAVILILGHSICNSQTLGFIFMPVSMLVSDTQPGSLQRLSVRIKDNSKAVLRWYADSLVAETFFSIEKSTNGIDFNVIGVTKSTGKGWYEFLDESSLKGKVFYRLKLSNDNSSSYSEMVTTVLSAEVSCKFYPNPVDKALIVRSELPVDLQIADKFGKPLIVEKLQAGLKVIDVSALEPGAYIITLYQKEGNRLLTETLIKK